MEPPDYRCVTCGCSGADACVDGVCYDAATRAAARDLDALPDDLDFGDYLALPLQLRTQDAVSLLDAAYAHEEESRADPRLNTFLIGWDPRSPWDDDITGRWLGPLDVNVPASTDVDCQPGTRLWPEGAVLEVVPPARAARPTCDYPGMFVDCVLPTNADCALGTGFQSETAIFLDLDVVLDDADAAMLIRAGRTNAATRDAALAEALATWGSAAGTVGAQPGLAIGDRYVAAWPSGAPHVTWVLLDARVRAALRLQTYRAVWSDPPSQQFLVSHDVQTRDCSFAHDAVPLGELPARVVMTCANAGATLTAEVDTAEFSIVNVTTAGG
jgi:hypothetical protein